MFDRRTSDTLGGADRAGVAAAGVGYRRFMLPDEGPTARTTRAFRRPRRTGAATFLRELRGMPRPTTARRHANETRGRHPLHARKATTTMANSNRTGNGGGGSG